MCSQVPDRRNCLIYLQINAASRKRLARTDDCYFETKIEDYCRFELLNRRDEYFSTDVIKREIKWKILFAAGLGVVLFASEQTRVFRQERRRNSLRAHEMLY